DPTVSIATPADGSAQAGVVSITGSATDAGSGVAAVTLSITGATATGCSPATVSGASPTWSFSCDWDTSALDDGFYTITATSTDAAGNTSVVDTSIVLIDNFAPQTAWVSWND